MKLLAVFVSLVKSVQFGIEYNESLRISEKRSSLIQEATSRNKVFGVKIERSGVTPTKSFAIDGFTDPFELYELSPESASQTYSRILSITPDGCYVMKGFRRKITPTVVNALFLKNIEMLCGCESLVVTKRDYLENGVGILNAFRLAGLSVKYVVPESLAYLAFLAYDRKVDSKVIVAVNLKGKKTTLSLNEVLEESTESSQNGARAIRIRRARTEVYEELSDDHIKKIVKDHLKEKIRELVSKQDIPVRSMDLPVSFVPGPLESSMYCNIDKICEEVLNKWKSGGSVYKPDHIDLYRIEGHKIDLEDVEISLREVEHKVRMFIEAAAPGLRSLLASIADGVGEFQTVVISEFMFGDFDTVLLGTETLRTNNSDIGIAKGALYLNFPAFTLECADVAGAHSDKGSLYTSQKDMDEFMEELGVYRRLREILDKVGGRPIKDVLDMCSGDGVVDLQRIADANDWCYENARTFVDEYLKHESKNKRLREDAEFRSLYIANLETMLKTAKELESGERDLWSMIRREYEDISEWFSSNRARDDVASSEFKNRYMQLEDSIGFFREKLEKQRAEMKRKAEESAERKQRASVPDSEKHEGDGSPRAPADAEELPANGDLSGDAGGKKDDLGEHSSGPHLHDEGVPAGKAHDREEL